jgi:hypothetical protein
MNHKELNKTLRRVNRKLRAALKQALVEVKYTRALLKLQEEKAKEKK